MRQIFRSSLFAMALAMVRLMMRRCYAEAVACAYEVWMQTRDADDVDGALG